MCILQGTSRLTIKISFTKKPMKPITTNPSAVFEHIFVNSAQEGNHLADSYKLTLKSPSDVLTVATFTSAQREKLNWKNGLFPKAYQSHAISKSLSLPASVSASQITQRSVRQDIKGSIILSLAHSCKGQSF